MLSRHNLCLYCSRVRRPSDPTALRVEFSALSRCTLLLILVPCCNHKLFSLPDILCDFFLNHESSGVSVRRYDLRDGEATFIFSSSSSSFLLGFLPGEGDLYFTKVYLVYRNDSDVLYIILVLGVANMVKVSEDFLDLLSQRL